MAGEEVNNTLPEDLTEKIIAMMPFPYLFKARLLSKSWLAKFEPISSQDDEEKKKRLASSFHKQLTHQCNLWKTFCPVRITDKDLIAYDRASEKWRRLPSLSFLARNVLPPRSNLPLRSKLQVDLPSRSKLQVVRLAGSTMQIEGALFYGRKTSNMKEHYVGNILTRRVKQLPSHPCAGNTFVTCAKFVCYTTSNTYKVILISIGDSGDFRRFAAHVYDSKVETWRTKKFRFSPDFYMVPVTCTYLDGVLYMMSHRLRHLLAFNVEKGTWEELRLSFNDGMEVDFVESAIEKIELAVCNGNLVMIVREYRSQLINVHVLKIDVESLLVWEVARCPPVAFKLDLMKTLVREVDCIFFQTGQPDNTIVAYDQNKDEWSFFSFGDTNYQWSACSFQPGLNPFAAI